LILKLFTIMPFISPFTVEAPHTTFFVVRVSTVVMLSTCSCFFKLSLGVLFFPFNALTTFRISVLHTSIITLIGFSIVFFVIYPHLEISTVSVISNVFAIIIDLTVTCFFVILWNGHSQHIFYPICCLYNWIIRLQ